jgi:hypothetical protein
MMRRASTCLAVLGLVVLALPGVASATPKVTLKEEAVPIPGYPGTGNILGAGSDGQFEFKISGTEYGGFPPPLIGVNSYLPSGTKVESKGFKTCPEKTIVEEKAPEKCPKGSAAGPIGSVLGVVAFGTERVPETSELFSFFAPGGGLEFFTFGHTPTTLEIPSTGHYVSLGGAGGFGPELIAAVPLVETVPGAPYASVEAIKIRVGAAYKKGKKTVYYGTMPTKCKGGLLVKATLTFAENGEISKPESVTATYKAPCPKPKK